MFLLKRAAAYFLLNRLFDRKQSYDKPFDGMDISAMEEVGNIIVGSYLTAISKLTNLTIEPSVPYISVDMAGAILSFAAIQLGQYGDNALMIETSFEDQDMLQGYLIFLTECITSDSACIIISSALSLTLEPISSVLSIFS